LEPNYKVKPFRSREITANFKFLGITYPTGVFYTDSNSFKVVKRNISLSNTTNKAAYFYPVQSLIFLESKDNQYALLPHSTLGGSAGITPGNIEFVVLRQGIPGGEDLVQGDYFETLSDWSDNNMGINVTYKFELAITDSRSDLFDLMHKTSNLK
jgi:Glycosyl hydrolases family 38 C-terminal domain